MDIVQGYTAFHGQERIANGPLADVAARVKPTVDAEGLGVVLIFDDRTGEQVDVDFRGGLDDVLGRLPATGDNPTQPAEAGGAPRPVRGPGRPKLGVVAREVTLLPRHWEWLSSQHGGASATLRKLVDQARRAENGRGAARLAQEAAFRFMNSMAGNLPGFEEATRGLFAGDAERFASCTAEWPADIRNYATRLAKRAFTT